MRRLRRLTEAECYARCYGASDETVQVIELRKRRPEPQPRLTGEAVRRLFEQRLEAREPEAA